MIKKIAIGVVALIIVVGVAVYFLFSNLDSIVKAAVEKYGTAATQADVRLDTVKLSITSGEGMLSGLSVGNPKGFATPHSFVLGSIDVKLDTSSITGSGPIVIKEVNIEKPQVTYERNESTSNLETIQKNAMAYGGMSGGAQAGKTGGSQPTPASTGGSDQGSRKFVINDLYVRDGQVAVSSTLLQGKTLSSGLPTIHLTNIGKDKGGATPAEIAQQVIGAISNAAAKVGSADLEKAVKGMVGDKLKGVAPSDLGDKAKSLLGK